MGTIKTVPVNLGNHSYKIVIGEGVLSHCGSQAREVFSGKRCLIITDDHIAPLYQERVEHSLQKSGIENACLVLPAGERSKSFPVLTDIYGALLTAGVSRSDFIVVLGGGVIGDIAGFAAATYLRGVPFLQIPTSLLAQVDSSVGGKVAADLPQGKNLVGAFHHPRRVLIDPEVLTTLPSRFLTDGMAEVIKYGCIFDADFFDKLKKKSLSLAEIIAHCCQLKASVVEEDERDTGNRMLLNFGHTIGHAIEKFYHFETYTHGEAVAMGMVAITRIAEKKGLSSPGTADRIQEILLAHHLPVELPVIKAEEMKKAMLLDKKNINGALNVVLLREIGQAYLYPTTIQFFSEME